MFSYGPERAKTSLRAYADSEDPDQLAQFDRDIRCPLTELLDSIEYFNGEQMPG